MRRRWSSLTAAHPRVGGEDTSRLRLMQELCPDTSVLDLALGRPTSPRSRAPSRPQCRVVCPIVWPLHEFQPVEVDDVPVMSMHAELEMLLAAHRVHEDRPPVVAHFNDSAPQGIPDPCRQMPDEHPRADLEQPPREVATQSRGTGGEDEHDHGYAHDLPPATVPVRSSHRSTTSHPYPSSGSPGASRSVWMSFTHVLSNVDS